LKKALIIGGGFSGCSAAHLLSLEGGWDVTLVEIAGDLGGGNKTRWYGGHPYTLGPRHFLTPMPEIYEYLNRYCPLRSCANHEFLTYIEQDASFYSYPIHRDDLPTMPDYDNISGELSAINMAALSKMSKEEIDASSPDELKHRNLASEANDFEEYWIKSIGATLYSKFVDEYSRKMWMIGSNKEIDDFLWSPKGATIKEGTRAAWNTAISAFPIAWNGYDDYFRISTADTKVLLNTKIEEYDIPNKTVVLNGEKQTYDVIISTISPDILFDHCHGELAYVGRELIPIVLPIEFAMPENVFFLYYAGKQQFTRIVEYKKLSLHKSPSTLITLEIPSRKNKLYPMPFESEKAKSHKYFDEMPDGVFSIGRAGSYLYNVDIDDAIHHSMQVVDKLKS